MLLPSLVAPDQFPGGPDFVDPAREIRRQAGDNLYGEPVIPQKGRCEGREEEAH